MSLFSSSSSGGALGGGGGAGQAFSQMPGDPDKSPPAGFSHHPPPQPMNVPRSMRYFMQAVHPSSQLPMIFMTCSSIPQPA
mmetsp:Transcript_17596/g.24267  ORF Transcript_17596/g.24267 Transcript_17596/m.24267 type:complete len:81 (-) Transcript_17596:198-440(-)